MQSKPRPLSVPIRWLLATAKVHWIGDSTLPHRDALIISARPTQAIGEALISQHTALSDHSEHFKFLAISTESDIELIRAALEIGRSEEMSVVPIGVAASPTIKFASASAIPLPRADIVVCVEVPFIVPQHPLAIANEWVRAVQQQLHRANGRAIDLVKTLRRPH